MSSLPDWFLQALFLAVFAALTVIFAKAGLESVDSDYTMLIHIGVSCSCPPILSTSPENEVTHLCPAKKCDYS